ncbi:hypothetical protein [Asaia platycodi]|uniref:hypothetical protein n=1 Tax=Asaia platycodi TaxID=610243 RepID=UPI00047012F0|nr:hypothetical protein [Asaia platycodi]
MPENLPPQPWWVAVIGGLLFTIRWLIGFGASSSKATIASQQEEIDQLNARVDNLEAREKVNLELIEELRAQNGPLREALHRANSAAVR